MASFKLNIAIAALVAESQTSVIDKLFAFLGEKIEIDEDMKGYFEEFKTTLKADQEVDAKAAKSKKGAKGSKGKVGENGEPKVKRAPSAYNLYIRDKMAEFKVAGHSGNLMKMAIEAWNEEKGAAKAVESSTEEEVAVEKKASNEESSTEGEEQSKQEPKADKKQKAPNEKKAPKEKSKQEPKAKKEQSDKKQEEESEGADYE